MKNDFYITGIDTFLYPKKILFYFYTNIYDA
jgi:hypothetical protein